MWLLRRSTFWKSLTEFVTEIRSELVVNYIPMVALQTLYYKEFKSFYKWFEQLSIFIFQQLNNLLFSPFWTICEGKSNNQPYFRTLFFLHYTTVSSFLYALKKTLLESISIIHTIIIILLAILILIIISILIKLPLL